MSSVRSLPRSFQAEKRWWIFCGARTASAGCSANESLPGDSPVVTLSDGLVTLRCWSRDDAQFMAEASADPAIKRYNGGHDRLGRPTPPLSTTDAEARIDKFALNWHAFAATGTPSGVAFAILDERSGELVGCCGVDDCCGVGCCGVDDCYGVGCCGPYDRI